ncbi:MAG: hypothetical protein FJY82_14470 [Candidatus Aminicenantes bacterium]|nr:hypothetical protein [Candidatus Aminicenantes bacterium]
MSKKILTAGSILILGLGLFVADASAQTQSRVKARLMFMDQNGDGISDVLRDHDNDGIPNCQDADWARPEDGTGFRSRNGRSGDMVGKGSGRHAGWSNAEFRNQGLSKGPFGTGVCDGAGPKGKGKGRR